MPSSYTALLKLNQPGLGDTGWGTAVNAGVTALVEQAVAGSVSVAVTVAGPNTLSAIASGASSDARNQFLILTGTLASPATLTVPAAPGATSSKLYFIKNSAGNTVTVETSGGTSVAVPNGKSMMLKVTTAGVEEAMTHAASLTLGTALGAVSGGTGQSSYTIGDLLYADTTTSLTKLAAAAVGNVLRAKGTGTAPAWEQVVLTTDVTGVLPAANGGTGRTSVVGSMTAQPTTSGTEKTFSPIPAGVKRITVMLYSVGTTGNDELIVQIGDSGGIETTSYSSGVSSDPASAGGFAASLIGFILETADSASASSGRTGVLQLSNLDGNTWVSNSTVYESGFQLINSGAGVKILSDVLTQVRITTVGGTDTFDSGSVNVIYE